MAQLVCGAATQEKEVLAVVVEEPRMVEAMDQVAQEK